MKPIEQEIQQRIQDRELGPIRIQWPDGIIDKGFVVDCPHSDPSQPHAALVPSSVFDERVMCPQQHDIYVTNREDGLLIFAEEPEDFSPPVILSESKIDFSPWVPRASMPERSDG